MAIPPTFEKAPEDRLLFIDYETWRLGANAALVLEVGWMMTDWNLDVSDDKIKHFVIKNDIDKLNQLPYDSLFEPHKTNGLFKEAINEDLTTSLKDVFTDLKSDIDAELSKGHRVMLAGNSVHFDRDRTLEANRNYHCNVHPLTGVHHHLIDFSVLNETFEAWNPDLVKGMFEKTTNHRVKNCLHDSLAQARFYKDLISRLS